MYVSVGGWMNVNAEPTKTRGIGSPGADVIGGASYLVWGPRTELRPHAAAVSALTCRAISSPLKGIF